MTPRLQRRARDQRHDLRLVRQPHRAQAQQDRRRQRDGQLRHREGQGQLSPDGVDTDELVAAVEAAGYGASAARPGDAGRRAEESRRRPDPVAAPAAAHLGGADRAGHRDGDGAGACSSPTGSGSRSPWPRRSWCGARWPFHRAAWVNLRHGTSTMDTLVSLGTLAAFGWSLYALFWGTAGEPGHDAPVRADRRSGPTARATSTSRPRPA